MSIRTAANRAGLSALLTAAWVLLMMRAASQYPFQHVFCHDVNSPVLALEISRNAGDIDAVLHRSHPEKAASAAESMSRVNRLDLVFIPLYAFSIWSLAHVFTTRTRRLALGILAAALFDYIEDWEIYRALAGESPAVYVPSLIKWGLLGLVFIALSRIMIRSDSPVYSLPTKRILAIGYFVSGVLILLDVVSGQWIGYSHIELGMALFALLTAINVMGLLGHYFAIPGIQPVYVENFCEGRKRARDDSMTAVKGERTD